MSCFDSTVYMQPSYSETKTYHSYMCESRGSYLIKENNKTILRTKNPAIFSKGIFEETRQLQISNLRNILSETISNVTKGNRIKKGESVELTLEIELMKTENNSPSNSLVEITIIQHNKTENNKTSNLIQDKNIVNKMPFQIEAKSSTSESASQKRKNWFHRVISRQYDENNLRQELSVKKTEQLSDNYLKRNINPAFCSNKILKDNNKNNITTTNNRENFITVLPEEITVNRQSAKGYRKVSPDKRTPRIGTNFQKPRNILTSSKGDSLVKKVSDLFLPNKKRSKNETVKTALAALKNEVDHIKIQTEKDKGALNKRKRKRTPVHNLGKLVNNILVDMMDNSDDTTVNKIKGDSLPLQYKSFFEPVHKSNHKNKDEKQNHRKIYASKRSVAESHSDTCCLRTITCDSLGVNLKTSNSTSNCKAQTHSDELKMTVFNDESKQIPSKKGEINIENCEKIELKNAEGDFNDQKHNNKTGRKRADHRRYNKKVRSKQSEIQWNGQTIKVAKEIKERIELLIVNELQNLALKEGMEWDVTPLPSTDDSMKKLNIEKMSSFLCELDIGDKKFPKAMKNKRISKSKLHQSQSSSKMKKKRMNSSKHRKEKKSNDKITKTTDKINQETTSLSKSNSGPNTVPQKEEEKKKLQTVNKDDVLIFTGAQDTDENELEVTYLHRNLKNWSVESTVTLHPEINTFPAESQTFEMCCDNECYSHAMSSGFMKRIKSDDSTWKKYKNKITEDSNSSKLVSKQFVTMASTKSELKIHPSKSNGCASNIEIELDIKDLEMILKEAKENDKADKILILAKCKRETKKEKEPFKFTGKNSPSYTNQLLSNASKKLEKFVKGKRKTQGN